MTYRERLDAYRARLVREIDGELEQIAAWLAAETDADARDGLRWRAEDLRRERSAMATPATQVNSY